MNKRGRPTLQMTAEERKVHDKVRYANWNHEHCKVLSFRFNVEKDSDVLQKLESVKNKVDYLRKLIKKDINNTCKQ